MQYFDETYFRKHKCVSLPKVEVSQRAEAILNKISNNINKTYIGLISVLQGFQKWIAWNPSN